MNISPLTSISAKVIKGTSIATAAIILGAASSAQAASLYATGVSYYGPGSGIKESDAYRKNTASALGSPNLTADSSNGYDGNRDFLSLGLGGRAIFDFGQDFSGNVTLWETTWGNKPGQGSYDERVDVYYGNFAAGADWGVLAKDLTQWTSAGQIKNIEDGAYNTAAGATLTGPSGVFNRVLLVDKSKVGNGKDGFDVNAIAVQGIEQQEVPEPTSILSLLMVGALGIQQIKASRKSTANQAPS